MSGKFWITANHFDENKVSFSEPEDIGNRYVRYNVRYIYDNKSIRNLALTTDTSKDLITCLGFRKEIGQYAKPNQYQSTLVLNKNVDSDCTLFGTIVKIVTKFKNDIIPDGELKCPVKELDDDTVKLYTKPIQSSDGKVYTVMQNKSGEIVDIDILSDVFDCRPTISINFVVASDKKSSMKLQIARMYVSDIKENININLADMD